MPIDYQPPKGVNISDAIATTTGVADAGKIPKTNSSGLIDDTFLANAVLLAGRSGGQTLSGDTGSAGNLTLQSTAHATKGYISLDGVVQKKVAQATTTDATPATPFSLVVAENSTVCFEAKVLAKETNGMRACYFLRGGFYRDASGNVTQIGSTHATENETDAALDATLAATTGTQTIDVIVTGKAATTILWDVVVNYFVN